MKLGMAPPRPSPVQQRATNSDANPLAPSVSHEKPPNSSSEPISVRRRPM